MAAPGHKLANSLLVVAICLVATGSALAGGNTYPTAYTKFKYELDDGEASFKGQIDSTKGNCVKDRKVVLYRKKNGDKKKLGGDHTNNKGKFDIDLGSGRPKNGTYYAKIKQTTIGSGTCSIGPPAR